MTYIRNATAPNLDGGINAVKQQEAELKRLYIEKDADKAAEDAEDQAALIRELAYDQARALAERAYKTGYQRGKDEARAKHAVMSKHGPVK